jgi:hypothetical protein
MTVKSDKLTELKQRQEKLAKQIAAEEQKRKGQERKDDTREKIILGGSVKADIAAGNTARADVVKMLKRSLTVKRDKEFMQARGWEI